jgi:hypothetical protein
MSFYTLIVAKKKFNRCNRLNQSHINFIQITSEYFHTLTVITDFKAVVMDSLEINLASNLYDGSQISL